MTLETVLRPFSVFAHLVQMGNDDPPPSGMKRKLHWVGNKEAEAASTGGKPGGQNPQQKDTRGYRELASITLGEVNDAHRYFASQLVPSPFPAWISPNTFCMIHLARRRGATRPPAVFGRIKTCYPSDGYIQNVQELEMSLPRKDREPDILHLQMDDAAPNKPVQSYCVKVPVLAALEDTADFAAQEKSFTTQGYFPEFTTNYIDLLDVNEHNHASQPWIYVICSRWFASIPISIQPEIREKLTKLIHWNKLIFNYHPENLPREIRTLNRELGMKAGYTERFLIEPETPAQTLQIVEKTFDKIFDQPMV